MILRTLFAWKIAQTITHSRSTTHIVLWSTAPAFLIRDGNEDEPRRCAFKWPSSGDPQSRVHAGEFAIFSNFFSFMKYRITVSSFLLQCMSQKKPENMAWPVQTTASPPENCHDWRRPLSRLIKNGRNPRTKWSFQWENHPLNWRMVTLKDDRWDQWDHCCEHTRTIS